MHYDRIGDAGSLRAGRRGSHRIDAITVSLAGRDCVVGGLSDVVPRLADVVAELLPLFADRPLQDVGGFTARSCQSIAA